MRLLLDVIPSYVLLFAVYSIAGWIMEVVLKYIQFHRFINRGFLIGPYCPIYGWGALLITLTGGGVFFRQFTPMEAFLIGFVLCGALEYAVSWGMEKTSHARWWDYSNKPMNLNGRIWIGNLLLFGAAAVGILYLTNPLLFSLIDKLTVHAARITAGAFLIVILTDRVITHFLMKTLKNCVEMQKGDSTEEIRLEMQKMLSDRTLLLRRIAQAYPELQPIPARVRTALDTARRDYQQATKRLRLELNRARRDTTQGAQEALKASVEQARAAQQRALCKLRELKNGLFH